jgi:hypothetical protein
MTKLCVKCNQNKDISEFDFLNSGNRRNTCRSCRNARRRQRREEDPELKARQQKQNRDSWQRNNWTVRTRERYQEDTEFRQKRLNSNEEYRQKHLAQIAKRKKSYSEAYYLKNKDRIKVVGREYRRKRRKEDPEFCLRTDIGAQISKALKEQKTFNTFDFLDYTPQELKAHLEKLFTPGMTWKNHNRYGWHIDHKIPQSWFDFSKPEQIRSCWALENLQPKWAKENLSKGNRYVG